MSYFANRFFSCHFNANVNRVSKSIGKHTRLLLIFALGLGTKGGGPGHRVGRQYLDDRPPVQKKSR